MAMAFDLQIDFDDQDVPVLVRADQRDMAGFERQHKIGTTQAVEQMPMIFFRDIGWRAMRRTGKTTEKFEVWDEKVSSVEPVGDEPDPNPTSPDQS